MCTYTHKNRHTLFFLSNTCLHTQEYSSLCFSPDGKLLMAQGGAPEWNMVLWVWEKSKIAGTVKTTNQQGLPVTAVSFDCCD